MAIDERVLRGAQSAEHIAPNVGRLRNIFELSGVELARLTGIKRVTLLRKMHGDPFTAEEVGRLAALFDMGPDRLYMVPVEFRRWVADHEDELEEAINRLRYEDPPVLPNAVATVRRMRNGWLTFNLSSQPDDLRIPA